LRTYLRQRAHLVEQAASHIQRMQQALTQMNLMLHLVLSDITGTTGLKIVRSILAGERDPARLAVHRDYRCHASLQEIIAALTGHYRTEHLFTLKQHFEAYEFNCKQIAECDSAIQQQLDDPGAAAYAQLHRTRVIKAPGQRPQQLGLALLDLNTGEILTANHVS
jgi:transposase